jgi:hypothetical protein
VPTYPYAGAYPCRESVDPTLLGNIVVKLTECCARLNPGCFIFKIDLDRPEIDEVNNYKWGSAAVGKAFIVMPPLLTLICKPCFLLQRMAAWISHPWNGVTMRRGFGAVEFTHLGFY